MFLLYQILKLGISYLKKKAHEIGTESLKKLHEYSKIRESYKVTKDIED